MVGPMTRHSHAATAQSNAAANQPLLQALGAFQQGRPADCVRLGETILAKHAKDPGALHLLGVARLRLGDSDGSRLEKRRTKPSVKAATRR